MRPNSLTLAELKSAAEPKIAPNGFLKRDAHVISVSQGTFNRMWLWEFAQWGMEEHIAVGVVGNAANQTKAGWTLDYDRKEFCVRAIL